MYIIAGLGNPGKQYAQTRHNVGFDTIDILADKYNISVDTKKHKALCGKGMIEGQKVVLAKPQTFMNLSGESVRELVDFYKINPEEELIVIYDDISRDSSASVQKEVPAATMASKTSSHILAPRFLNG